MVLEKLLLKGGERRGCKIQEFGLNSRIWIKFHHYFILDDYKI